METGALSHEVITGSDGILKKMELLITETCADAWPIITTIVGIALLFYLGRALLRAVRSYFGTAS